MADHLASTALGNRCVFLGELRLGTPGFGNLCFKAPLCFPYLPSLFPSAQIFTPVNFNHVRTLNTPSSHQHLSSASSHPTRAAYHVCSKSRPVNTQHLHFSFRRPSIQLHILHCTITSTSQSHSSTRFPLPSIASTSRFYWEFLVYIIDQIKKRKDKKRCFS